MVPNWKSRSKIFQVSAPQCIDLPTLVPVPTNKTPMEPELSPTLVGASATTGGAAAACAVGSSKNSSNQGNLLKGIDNK